MIYDAIFFDFDGVLADSEPLHHACWSEVLKPVGVVLDWQTYADNCIGVSDIAMLDFFAALSGGKADAKQIGALYPKKQELFRARSVTTQLIPAETIELVESLTGIRRAVVTSSVRVEIEPILARAGLLSHLYTVVYGGDVRQLKPAPDPYLLAAERTGALYPLVLEDSVSGITAAEAAGFDVIRVSTPSEVPALVRARIGLQKER